MKLTNTLYAKTLHEALAGKTAGERKEIFKRFLYVLRKNKDLNRLGMIIKETEKEGLRRTGLSKLEIETPAQITPAIKQELASIFNNKMLLEERTSPGLLAGIRIIVDDELLIDATAKSRIDKIFK